MVLQGLVSRYCLGGWTLRCRLYLCVATVMWWDTDKVEEAPWRFWEDEQYPHNVDDRMLQAVLRYHFCLSPLVVTTTRCLVYSWSRRWAGTDKPCLTMFGIVSTMIREGAYFKWTWFENYIQRVSINKMPLFNTVLIIPNLQRVSVSVKEKIPNIVLK